MLRSLLTVGPASDTVEPLPAAKEARRPEMRTTATKSVAQPSTPVGVPRELAQAGRAPTRVFSECLALTFRDTPQTGLRNGNGSGTLYRL